ncbi:splicing factor 3a [Capsaspora owczarzaki ATCC 30864]|uniref:Splicing factor 3a n=1 Tax=Capsaspora owczarzaki (strain ATCC 30864) TaxID=595528 RepID=A0A0D2WJN4_CAPO3|nr:splicing factor 3a [Capsaspora owczarzaki ATCC 30864]KJE90320.1 splicing factor 3a [Capsaspora owczarzaki ATCC 30864]|eukprot:XP_004364516.2 splicing factor 3a [Capsaspora owczarzaki ATCC 30864]
MSFSLLEQQRRLHEERDRLERGMARRLQDAGKAPREVTLAEHQVKELLERYQQRSSQLSELYADEDGARRDELALMGGVNGIDEFYNRLRSIRDAHRRNPGQSVELLDFEMAPPKPAAAAEVPPLLQPVWDSKTQHSQEAVPMSLGMDQRDFFATEDEQAAQQKASSLWINRPLEHYVTFSDEEASGKFLDLHAQYSEFINIKRIERLDYLQYLELFDQLFDIPKDIKLSASFKHYLSGLSSYLVDFHKRIRPLYDLESDFRDTLVTFESEWRRGIFIGWNTQVVDADRNNAEPSTAVYCDACEKWFPKQTVYQGHLSGKNHKKAEQKLLQKQQQGGDTAGSMASIAAAAASESTQDVSTTKDIAALEAIVYRLTELLGEQREATRINVERKQALTAEELHQEQEDDAIEIDEEEEDDGEDKPIYNPKNLPLGWDGKPIPYWLYKLHGLNLEFKCEICGDATYRGPKIFQRHFQEWRHAFGMRRIGIPNSLAFQHVTKIDDARALWNKLQMQKNKEKFVSMVDEEFEDSLGNVMNFKTHQDLLRQGLI